MKRVVIIGPPGSGKSTLAPILGEVTGLPVVHLDNLFWKPGWVQTPRDEWSRIVSDVISEDS
jgi:adenylate kinase family enzyme